MNVVNPPIGYMLFWLAWTFGVVLVGSACVYLIVKWAVVAAFVELHHRGLR